MAVAVFIFIFLKMLYIVIYHRGSEKRKELSSVIRRWILLSVAFKERKVRLLGIFSMSGTCISNQTQKKKMTSDTCIYKSIFHRLDKAFKKCLMLGQLLSGGVMLLV